MTISVRAFVASPLGFLVGLALGALGGGGSVLAIPVLVYAAGQSPQDATATSLVLVGIAALVGLRAHWRAGRVRVGVGTAFGGAGLGGSLAGSAVNHWLDPTALLLGFSGLVLIAAWRMLVGCPTCTKVGETRVVKPDVSSATVGGGVMLAARTAVASLDVPRVIVAGTVVGFLTGLFGVGGGFVIVPALALVARLPMPEAVGTSLLVIAINAAVALGARVSTTDLDWAVTIPFAISAVSGVVAGGRVASKLDARRSLRWFAGLLIAVSVYTAIRAISAAA